MFETSNSRPHQQACFKRLPDWFCKSILPCDRFMYNTLLIVSIIVCHTTSSHSVPYDSNGTGDPSLSCVVQSQVDASRAR